MTDTDNGMKIWEPARGYLHDTDSNLNFVDLTEPYEVYASPVYPNAFPKRSKADPVRYFRKVCLFQDYPEIVDYFKVSDNGEVVLRKHKGSESERYQHFSKKIKHVIHTFASKSKVTKYMEKLSSYGEPMTQTKFFKKVYRLLRKAIRKAREHKYT